MMANIAHVVVIDGMNFLHRARVGKKEKSQLIIRNFVTGLRALVQLLDPSRVLFVTEGTPHERLAIFPAYKANRAVEQGSPKQMELAAFYDQCAIAIDLARQWLPIGIMRHPRYEADDVISAIITNASSSVRFTIVSSDSDFIQLLERPNVAVYNPITRQYRLRWECDYVMWKALRGDQADNIPPVLKGSQRARDTEATRLMSDPAGLMALFADSSKADRFAQNIDLIKFAKMSEIESFNIESSVPIRDWCAFRDALNALNLTSVTREPYWTNRFVATFDRLFGANHNAKT